MKAIIKAFFDLIKVRIIKRKFYLTFTAFTACVLSVKLDEDVENDNVKWNDIKLTIYDLDDIVNEMNINNDFIKEKFHLSVDKWTRDDIRPYIELLDVYYYRMSEARKKEFSCIEILQSLLQFIEESWISQFKEFVKMYQELNV